MWNANSTQDSQLSLCLYVNGQSSGTVLLTERLRDIFGRHLDEPFLLEVIDVATNPTALERDNVIALPTLIKRQPEPVIRLVGDLSNEDLLLHGMDVMSCVETADRADLPEVA